MSKATDLNSLCREAVETAKKHGFYEEKATISTLIAYLALINTEISEAIEAIEKEDTVDTRKELMDKQLQINTRGFSEKDIFEAYRKNTLEDELADIIIRVFSFCGAYKFDIQTAIEKKMEYNKLRPVDRHGKRF